MVFYNCDLVFETTMMKPIINQIQHESIKKNFEGSPNDNVIRATMMSDPIRRSIFISIQLDFQKIFVKIQIKDQKNLCKCPCFDHFFSKPFHEFFSVWGSSLNRNLIQVFFSVCQLKKKS